MSYTKKIIMKFISILIFSLTISFSSYINSQKNNIIKNLEWRNIGPDRGGRSLAVSGEKFPLIFP